jgi:hypothetical protein
MRRTPKVRASRIVRIDLKGEFVPDVVVPEGLVGDAGSVEEAECRGIEEDRLLHSPERETRPR